jgi:hypothetical protein
MWPLLAQAMREMHRHDTQKKDFKGPGEYSRNLNENFFLIMHFLREWEKFLREKGISFSLKNFSHSYNLSFYSPSFYALGEYSFLMKQ